MRIAAGPPEIRAGAGGVRSRGAIERSGGAIYSARTGTLAYDGSVGSVDWRICLANAVTPL